MPGNTLTVCAKEWRRIALGSSSPLFSKLPMKQAVFRERNKNYYRVLHTPIWI